MTVRELGLQPWMSAYWDLDWRPGDPLIDRRYSYTIPREMLEFFGLPVVPTMKAWSYRAEEPTEREVDHWVRWGRLPESYTLRRLNRRTAR